MRLSKKKGEKQQQLQQQNYQLDSIRFVQKPPEPTKTRHQHAALMTDEILQPLMKHLFSNLLHIKVYSEKVEE